MFKTTQNLVDLLGGTHGGLDVGGLQVLPVLLQQGNQEVQGDDGVLADILDGHLDVADGAAHAQDLLQLVLCTVWCGESEVKHSQRLGHDLKSKGELETM